MRQILWSGWHQRGALGSVTMSLRGLVREDINDIVLAMRRYVDAPLEF